MSCGRFSATQARISLLAASERASSLGSPEQAITFLRRWFADHSYSSAQRVDFELYPQDWRLRKGHRIGVFLSGSDESWFSPIPTMSEVSIENASLHEAVERTVGWMDEDDD